MDSVVTRHRHVLIVGADQPPSIPLDDSISVTTTAPASLNGDVRSAAVVVVTDEPSLSAVTARQPSGPVFGYGVDGDGVDAVADDPETLAALIRGAAAARQRESSGDGEPDAEAATFSRLERLHEGTAELVAARDPEGVYELMVEIAGDVIGYDHCYVGVVEGEEFVPKGGTSAWQGRLPLDHGILGRTYRESETFIVDDAAADPGASPALNDLGAAISVPVGDRGVFQVATTEPHAYDETDGKVLSLLASYADTTLARIESESALRDRNETVAALQSGISDLVTVRDRDELYERAVDVARRVLAFDDCHVHFVEGDRFVPGPGSSAAVEEAAKPLPLDHGLMGWTHDTGESALVDDIEADARTEPVDQADGVYRSAISVPVGEYAVFQAASAEVAAFDETDLEFAELLASSVENIHSRIGTETTLRESRQRVTELHEGVTELIGVRDAETVFDLTVEIADRVLDLDRCAAMRIDGEYLVPESLSDGAEPDDAVARMHRTEGLAGWCYTHGESRLVSRVEEEAEAKPAKEEYRSAISVPIGDHGVFQAVSTSESDFDESDLEMAELLTTHAAETLTRIRADDRLRAERDRLAALFENVPDAAVAYEYVDGEPIVHRVNSAFEETFGYAAEEVDGECIDEYIIPVEEGAAEEAEELNRKLQAGESVRTEVERMTADGPRHFILHVIPIQLGTENVSGYAIYTDVTDRREREAQLRRQNERLDEFASIVSHDLRNPLSVASGYLDLARETGDPEHFERVESALDRMDDLVGDLLSLARKGEVVGDTREVSLEALARRAWDNVATDGATLVVESDRTVEVDPDRAQELLENLFRNAIEHGSTGDRTAVDGTETERDAAESGSGSAADDRDVTAGGAPTVRVGATEYRSGERAGFYVEDDGPGIPDEDRDRVFETGYTTDEDGTGLGLAISRHIAEAHGWDVRALSGREGGARFEFKTDGSESSND